MLSPSDFNNAVPQFTNGNYASNPLNPQYIAEPSSTDYNRGVEPIQTLPAQWWNWFMNKFTTRFNKVNVYVKNIFNELSQLLSLVSETPSGTEGDPTIGQLKDMFETKYPDYLKTTPALSNTYVPQTTTINGQALSGSVTVCCVACAGANGSGTAFGTASTLNTGTAAGCIPIVGTALGTTDGQFVATDSNGCLKPSGYTASCFRASTWTPTCVACAGADGSGCAFGTAARCAATAFRACTWIPSCVNDKYGTHEIGIGYSGPSLSCDQVRSFAAYSQSYTTGCTVIKDVDIPTVKCLLGICDLKPNLAECSCATYYTGSAFAFACTGKNGSYYCWKLYNHTSKAFVLAPLANDDVADTILGLTSCIGKIVKAGCTIVEGCTMTESQWNSVKNCTIAGFVVW